MNVQRAECIVMNDLQFQYRSHSCGMIWNWMDYLVHKVCQTTLNKTVQKTHLLCIR